MPYYPKINNLRDIKRRPTYMSPVWSKYATTASSTTVLVSNSSYWLYIGEAPRVYRSGDFLSIFCNISTAAATITWAESGLYTGTYVPGSSVSLTKIDVVDVSANFNTTGLKSVTYSFTSLGTSIIEVGTGMWAALGSQATTPYQLYGGFALTNYGLFLSNAATRLSTASNPITPSTISAVVPPSVYVAWY